MSARTGMAILAAAVVLAVSMPAAAAGEVVSTHVVSRVGGPELVRQLLSHVRGVQLGSTSATVTVETDGELRSIGVDVSGAAQGIAGVPGVSAVPGAQSVPGIFAGADGSAASGAQGAQGDLAGLVRLAAIPFVVSTVVRFLRFLAKLGSM